MTKRDKEIILEFRDLSLSFDEKQVLDHINLKLTRGEMIFITGESDVLKVAIRPKAKGSKS